MNKHTAIHILGDNPSVEGSNPLHLWSVHSGQEIAVPYGFVCVCFVAWYTVHVAYDVHLPILTVW